MRKTRPKNLLWAVVAVSAIGVTVGIVMGRPVPVCLGAVGFSYCLLRFAAATGSGRKKDDLVPSAVHSTGDQSQDARDADQPDVLVRQMLARGRYSLLLRPQIAGNLDDEQFRRAVEALETSAAARDEQGGRTSD